MSDENIKALVKKRGSIKARQTLFKNYLQSLKHQLENCNNLATVEKEIIIELENRLDRHILLFREFKEIQTEIEFLDENQEQQISEREQFENVYYLICSQAKKITDEYHSLTKPNSDDSSSTNSCLNNNSGVQGVKLPPINLQKFSGEYKNWLEFRDLFESLINSNNSISNIQKFHYLRASLEGGAAQVIRNFEISSDNYTIAWNTLCSRYENRALLVQNHIKSLFSLPNLSNESAGELRKMVDAVSRHLYSLKNLNQPTDSWDTILIYVLSGKLDKKSSREWEEQKNNQKIQGSIPGDVLPTFSEFMAFLKQKADLLETLELSKENLSVSAPRNRQASYATFDSVCSFCKGRHFIQNCSDFIKLRVNDRVEKVKELRLCFNCLRTNHPYKECKSSGCRKCQLKHNSLLHYDRAPSSTATKPETKLFESKEGDQRSEKKHDQTSGENDKTYSMSVCSESLPVLLQTALVKIIDSSGVPRMCRALLDGASQINLITKACCEPLGLEQVNLPSAVTGVGDKVTQLKYRCRVEIQSCVNAFKSDISCVVIPKISAQYPSCDVSVSEWNIPNHLKLADPEFNKSGDIDLLIGGGIYLSLLCIGQVNLGNSLPVMQKTKLGWILGGEMPKSNMALPVFNCNLTYNLDLQGQLVKFWEIEEVQGTERVFSMEEKQCEDIFSKTTYRDLEGRFVVHMPFKGDITSLGDSREYAVNRFHSLESKLARNPLLREKYVNFMEEYQTLSHMVKVVSEVDLKSDRPTFYFPHHGVINEKSLTTKLRVVFNGSSPSDSGVSLNDLQMVGPTIQDDLVSVLLRFRQHNVVVCSDIVKMYRQILIDPSQHSLQRVLWRSDPSQKIETFELRTVTYGTSSAPFLAVRCLKQLSLENMVRYPEASQVISRDFYMDDMITGTETVEEAIKLCDEVSVILKSACFELQKWASNKSKVLDHVNAKSSSSILVFGEDKETKTLGLYWACERDFLMYRIGMDFQSTTITKRSILSDISQIFDPLGLLGPCIIVAKIILQRLWLAKVSWDETLPLDIETRWRNFKVQLPSLNNLKIPRHVLLERPTRIEIHGFGDASLEAYGACVYVRSINEAQEIRVQLLCAKTKVAPLKSLTIPRLELSAALLLVNLVEKVKTAMNLQFNACFLWSDSTVCLSWIRTPPNVLQMFVSNRVAQIQTLSNPDDWNHVSTNDNPADLLSRGLNLEALQFSAIWWQGPAWLSKPECEWPKTKFQPLVDIPERKKQVSVFKIEKKAFTLFTKFSSLSKLNRVWAYCLRFIENCRSEEKLSGPLTTAELQRSLNILVKISQNEVFSTEISELSAKQKLNSKSKLLKLNPFLDSECILRVGGRIELSNYPYEKKHPAVLCASHPLTKLLFSYEHQRLLHAGPQLLLSSIREKFWPLGGRNLARKIFHSCVRCFRTNPTQSNPIMGVLPEQRVKPALPFSTTGVDYAGPLFIKNKRGRGSVKSKCYIALFVCFITKAVHIELVTDLTKEAFIAAFRRFTSRRGKPLNLFSDNGTNFVGAKHELEELGKFLKQNNSDLFEAASSEGVNWKFIPAFSPHFGGLWEAGVKSCKTHLKRVLANSCLTYEDLYTVLVEIEAILNSRPLTPLSSDPSDLTALTPSHFLIGKTLTSLPDPDVTTIKESRLSQFQRLQQYQQHFWSRWSLEYISELQSRQKWRTHQASLQPGALVVLKEENVSPLCWSLGRIERVHPGPDGYARVATVKTVRGCVKRAFTKICPLPVEQ